MTTLTYDELLAHPSLLELPQPHQKDVDGETVTSVQLAPYAHLSIIVPHHRLFPLQYSIAWDQHLTYHVIASTNPQETYHDIRVECECGGDPDPEAICDGCGRQFFCPTVLFIEKKDLGELNAWLTATFRSGGADELEATLRASVMEDLLACVDSVAYLG